MQPLAIVTASGKGMGAACARELASRGYQVALMSPSGRATALAQELGGVGMDGSVTEPSDLEALVELAMSRYGRVDALINNTGHPQKGPLLSLSDDEWRAGVDLILLSVIRMARLVTPIMQRQGGGAIVNLSTFAAYEPNARFPISATIRAALGTFTKLYADQHAADNIRMNCVLPGFIDSLPVDEATAQRIPLGRPGRVKEIARTVAFLLSEDAGYITGQSLRVDGGITRSV
jgi:NAD(P)-dependent dehydrogenase (short-subunit alcohol dehydrogenase family)